MANNDETDNDEKRGRPAAGRTSTDLPSQIPLLNDIVTDLSQKPKRRPRREKENLSLALDPEPPVTPDLFADTLHRDTVPQGGDATPTDRQANEPAPADDEWLDDNPLAAVSGDDFQRQARELVDRFVAQHSEEILSKLRSELISLLEDLKAEDDEDGKAQS